MTDNGITNYGREQVHRDLLRCAEDVEKAKKALERQQRSLSSAEKALTCDHDLEPASGYIYVSTRCRKCGYIWYD